MRAERGIQTKTELAHFKEEGIIGNYMTSQKRSKQYDDISDGVCAI
jgi:hypothetical protein